MKGHPKHNQLTEAIAPRDGIGRIAFSPELPHTASRMEPFDALAQHSRDCNRAYERDWHIWRDDEIDAFAIGVDVPRTVAEICLNFHQVESAAGRNLSLENLGLLAQRIEWYGRQRFGEGEMAERERYQEQGE